jgi:hypothetical protein
MSLLYSTHEDRPVSRSQLAMIPTPPPRGPRHRPYPFGSYVEDVHEALDRVGITVAEEEYAVTKDHQRMFGMMEIEASNPLEGELITADEWRLELGLRGSHDQRTGRGLVLGDKVMVCSNLQLDFALRNRAGDAALVEIFRRDGLSSAQLGRAINEWHEPSFDEHGELGWTLWRLKNAVTQSLKPTGRHVNMDLVANRSQTASTFLDEIAGIDF